VTDEEVIAEALRRIAEESATWLRADLARHLATLLPPETAGDSSHLVAEIDRLASIAEYGCLPIGPERESATRRRRDGRPIVEHVTDRRLTLRAVLAEEQRLQYWATSAANVVVPAGDPQPAAAEAITGTDRLVIVVGPAGTGKTRTTASAVEALRRQGRPVVGLAPSGKAADVLALEARCPTDTLAGFLTRHRSGTSPWPAGTTVILDEAGMAPTADLARLVDLVEANRWRLVAVGDPEQLPAVGRGGVFAHWCDTLPHHTLDTPRRFTEPWEADASLALRAGHPDAAATYAQHTRLHTSHPATLPGQVAQAHRHHTQAGRTVAITTTNAETAREINREIQWHTHRRPRGGALLHDGTSALLGDQIATRRNHRQLVTDRGQQVRNRHTWTVTATAADGSLTVTHPDRGTVELPTDYVREHVELGWAVTGYGNQGDTVDIGIAVLDTATSRNHAYVAMTRGRHANYALIVDPTGTLDPAETLADMISRAPNRDSALATRTRLYRDADIPETPFKVPDPQEAAAAARREAMQRRLDALQRRPSVERTLGL